MTNTVVACTNINLLKESQIPAVPSQNELYAVEMEIKTFTPNILDFKWSDHLLNDQSWTRADTFSWQDGTVYSTAYNHLVADITGKTLQAETIAGQIIRFYLADDGHKIVPAQYEGDIRFVYGRTGVAWYYVLDTDNQQFKLPITRYGFNGLRDTVGKYISESLPNITGSINGLRGGTDASEYTGVFSQGTKTNRAAGSGSGSSEALFNASGSSSVYQDNAPVQQRATQMYLYFYVGEFSKSATEQTAGLNAELFNSKVDKDDLTECQVVIETYVNGTSGYRIWSDGYCEQWGSFLSTSTTENNIQLVKTYKDEYYVLLCQPHFSSASTDSVNYIQFGYLKTSNSFKLKAQSTTSRYFDWKASGYLAEGEY